MEFIITNNYEELSLKAAEIVKEFIKNNPKGVLGFPTGRTPEGMYKNLVDFHKKEGLDFSGLTTFNLDEYIGLTPDDPNSYHYFMYSNLFNHVNINKDNVHIPNGVAEDLEEECKRYEESIEKAGGIDLQILGVGKNGHIGFNEPDEYLSVDTHVVDLTEDTIEANSSLFPEGVEVPRKAITMGMGTILKAKKILILISGKSKREVMEKLLMKKVTTSVPVSMLHLHRDVTVIVDKEAMGNLR